MNIEVLTIVFQYLLVVIIKKHCKNPKLITPKLVIDYVDRKSNRSSTLIYMKNKSELCFTKKVDSVRDILASGKFK